MIETYQAPEALALLDKIGWPEWDTGNLRWSLTHGDIGFCISTRQKVSTSYTMIGSTHRLVTDHEALCLLQAHLRGVLAASTITVHVEYNGKMQPIPCYYIERDRRNEDGYYEGDGWREVLTSDGWQEWGKLKQGDHPRWFDDLDEALLAGAEHVLAA